MSADRDLTLLADAAYADLLVIHCEYCDGDRTNYVAAEDPDHNTASELALCAVNAGWRTHPIDGGAICKRCYTRLVRCIDCRTTQSDVWHYTEDELPSLLCHTCFQNEAYEGALPPSTPDQDDMETQQQEFYGTYYEREML